MSESCTNKTMDSDIGTLPDNVNPGTFPAKLWRLVSNPENTSICWDQLGETILINEELFKSQILSPSPRVSDNPDSFKTTKFCSFVRQLNLYGFKKNIRTVKVNIPFENETYHCFYHKNFNRNRPELIADLKRLTADNKAKLSAGLKVSHRPWTRCSGSGECKNKKRTTVVTPTHPYCSDKAQAATTNNSTPVYPLYLMNSSNNAAALPEIPVPLNQQNTAVSCSGPVHIQQSFPTYSNHGIPNFSSYDVQTAQDPAGLYSPCFQYYPANILTSHMAGSGLQLRPFAPYHCYQMAEKLMPPPTNSLSVKLPNPETADNGFHHINQEIITDNYLSHDTHRMDSGGPKSTEVLDVKHGDPARFDSSMAPDSSTSTPMQVIP
uniref:Heat shock factor protein 5-like n=1 Tax=Cynoglossus semilaevis TaxID=244447 RepID=A0A3P8VRH9_CYNSE